jgi:sugar (pentulose or hexulose) kinase
MNSEKAAETARRLDAHFANDYHLPPVTDSWHDVGPMSASWAKSGGFFKYSLLMPGVVAIAAQALTPGTVSDGTTILTAANGLPAGYLPSHPAQLVATTNFLKTAPVGTASYEPAWLEFEVGGSVQCFGFGLSATFANCFGLIFTTIP